MTTWFVTRHPGAIVWAAQAGVKVADRGIVESLDPEQVQAGDTVIGVLPVNLAARVVERGAEFIHLALEVPPEARGKELSADDMRRYGARLERYDIRRQGIAQTLAGPHDGGRVMVVIASGQVLPNLLPLLALDRMPEHLYLAISASAEAAVSAAKIERVAGLLGIATTRFDGAPAGPLADVRRFAQEGYARIRAEYPIAHIVLNATGGTKVMSSGFASALGPSGEVLYCDTAHDRIEYFSPEGRAPITLDPGLMNLEVYLMAQGQRIVDCTSRDGAWLDGVARRAELTRFLVGELEAKPGRTCRNVTVLNAMADGALPDKSRNKAWMPQQTLGDLPGKLQTLIEHAGVWMRAGSGGHSAKIEFAGEDGARYLRGGWLEEYCALVMQELGVPGEHWGCGVRIAPLADDVRARANDTGESLNELDLALVWRNRLLVVECKTGWQLQNRESQSILNKLEAIRSYAAGSFGEGWLLNVHFLRDGSPAIQRAAEYRISLHERESIALLPLLLRRWMKQTLSEQEATRLGAMEDTLRARKRV